VLLTVIKNPFSLNNSWTFDDFTFIFGKMLDLMATSFCLKRKI